MGLPKDYEHHTVIVATGSKLMFLIEFPFHAYQKKEPCLFFFSCSLDATILFVFVVSGDV
jgi:hypothetical protein